MAIARLYLVRHGETDWNTEGRIQGHTPTALNDTGWEQARLLGRFFATCPLAAVWSSDLPRAYETAGCIAAPHGLAVLTTRDLRERDLGPFEGMTGGQVEARLRSAGSGGRDYTSWYEVPGVEQDREVVARVLPVMAETRKLDGEAVLVSHGGVQKAVLFHILGIPEGARRAFRLTNGLVISLVPQGESDWRVDGMHGLETIRRLLASSPVS